MTEALLNKVRELTEADPGLGYRSLHAKLQEDPVLQGTGIKKVQSALRQVSEQRLRKAENHLEAAEESESGAKALKAAIVEETRKVGQLFATHCTFYKSSDVPFSCEDGEYYSGGERDQFTFTEGVAVGRPVQYQHSKHSSSGFSRYGGERQRELNRIAEGIVTSVAQRLVIVKWTRVDETIDGTSRRWKKVPQSFGKLEYFESEGDLHMSFNGVRLGLTFTSGESERNWTAGEDK